MAQATERIGAHPPLIVRVLNGALNATHRPRALMSGLSFREKAR